jgi:hypothetical protein
MRPMLGCKKEDENGRKDEMNARLGEGVRVNKI